MHLLDIVTEQFTRQHGHRIGYDDSANEHNGYCLHCNWRFNIIAMDLDPMTIKAIMITIVKDNTVIGVTAINGLFFYDLLRKEDFVCPKIISML